MSDPDGALRTEPKFRTATIADSSWIADLIESAYRGDSSRVGWTTEAHLLDGQRTDEDGVRVVLTAPDSRMIVAEQDGDPLACCQLEYRGTHAYFGMFAVRPSAQGTGLGRQVLAEAERVARDELGVRAVHMTVLRQRDDLIAWYERRGYVRTGEMKPFPYGDERFGKPRRDDLEFEVLIKELAEENQATDNQASWNQAP